jgi:hypothetical protein
MPTKSPVREDVLYAVRRVLRRGLPVTSADADAVLLGLRGVVARAKNPMDEASRVAALNGTLRGLLAQFPDPRYAPAARALFGLPPAGPGQNLTVRRELAARAAEHEVHHFRKRVEPRVIERVVYELLADAERFTRLPMVAPRLARVGVRQPVPADPFAWEVAEQEEQMARLWSALYAARAALLAVERLVSLEADRGELTQAAVTAAWRWAGACAEAVGYTSAYAPDPELSADQLLELVGWTPPLAPVEVSRLTEAATGNATRPQFVRALHGETELGNAWVRGLIPDPALENGAER